MRPFRRRGNGLVSTDGRLKSFSNPGCYRLVSILQHCVSVVCFRLSSILPLARLLPRLLDSLRPQLRAFVSCHLDGYSNMDGQELCLQPASQSSINQSEPTPTMHPSIDWSGPLLHCTALHCTALYYTTLLCTTVIIARKKREEETRLRALGDGPSN